MDWLQQKLWFGLFGWLVQRLQVRVISKTIYDLAFFHSCIQCLIHWPYKTLSHSWCRNIVFQRKFLVLVLQILSDLIFRGYGGHDKKSEFYARSTFSKMNSLGSSKIVWNKALQKFTKKNWGKSVRARQVTKLNTRIYSFLFLLEEFQCNQPQLSG